jgi:VIT1/CCC1 family predicted Fe2+/Mn2+ transporter
MATTPGQRAERAPPPPNDAAARLLQAWRGEIEAGKMYELIAAREADSRRAEILRKMAVAESSHRRRLEQRMAELGIAVPDPATVRLSWWQRMQARVAPIDRLLAAREAAENDEVGDLYKRPTGDPDTDRLLHEIRKDERSHSLAVKEMLTPGSETFEPDDVISPAQARLDRILNREKGHTRGGGWISGAIYGANDGLAAVFGIVSGVSGATNGSSFVLTAGLAGAIASALSMATGAFLAERSQMEVTAANIDRERQEITQHPEEEKEELSLFYQLKGIDRETADALAERLSHDPEAMLKVLAAEELGVNRVEGNPTEAALAGGLSTAVGAIVPVIPFFFVTGTTGIVLAAIVSLVAHFLVGAAKSLVTLRSWWSAGLEMTSAGVIVGGALYGVGLILPVGG